MTTGLVGERERPANAREMALLAILAVVLLAPGISSFPPVDRDEPRYAVASTQMLDTGQFVDIRYQAARRYLQPAGVYWLQAASTALFSSPGHRSIWTYRLPSLLGAVLAVVATGFMASRQFGRRVGLSAATLLATCLSLGFEARIGKTDAALLSTVVVAQFALMRAYVDGPLPRALLPRGWAAAFWIALGAGVLLKGPIILMVVGLTVLALVAWDRRPRWLARLRPAWGVPLMLLVALPWYVAIGIVSHGEFFRVAIGRSLMGKVAAGQQAHGGPFGYHLLGLPLTFWPGSLVLAMAPPLVWRKRHMPEVRFLLAWIAPSWLVFELVKTKLPHYVLPLFPALACLAALALLAPRRPVRPWMRGLFLAFTALWVLLSLVVAGLGTAAVEIYARRFDLVALALGVAVAAAAAMMLIGLARRRPGWVLASAAAASLFAAVDVYAWSAPQLQPFWISPRVVDLARATAPCPGGVLISTPYHEPSLVFLNGSNQTVLAQDPAHAADALAAGSGCSQALIDARGEPDFRQRAKAIGMPLRQVGALSGRDYADGRNLTLSLFNRNPSTTSARDSSRR